MDKNKATKITPKSGQKKSYDAVAQTKRAQMMKDKLLAQIEEIDLNTPDYARKKENINKIYKLNGGMFATNISKDRDVEFTVTSTSKIKELVESSQKIAKIMDHFIDSIGFFTKKGNTDKAMELIKDQALLQDSIDETTKKLNEISEKYLRKGIGSKLDIEALARKDKELKEEEIKNLHKRGMACSEIATKFPGVDIEHVKALTAPFRSEYLEAQKDEIKKAIIKKENLTELASKLGIKNKVLIAALNIWALDDEKLSKVWLDPTAIDTLETGLEKQSKTKPNKEEEVKEAV